MQSHYPSILVSSLIVNMDYIQVPMKIDVVLGSSYQCEASYEKEELDDFRRQAKENEGQFAIINVRARDGDAVTDFADLNWAPRHLMAMKFLLMLPLMS